MPISVLPPGFTFSFPIDQQHINSGYLLRWSKSFRCRNCIGRDVVKLLDEAIRRRRDMKIDIVALVNDSTGTLMAGAYYNKQCHIGMILGTGTNVCYMEKLGRIGKWNEPLSAVGPPNV